LRDNKESDARVRIMKNIIAIGQSAIPVITERINAGVPWYYLRNLAYMLGQIGSGKCAEALQPLLCHENNRVRMEALKSLQRTGGEERVRIMLAVLPAADENFKMSIVEALGSAKNADAVNPLLDMLKNRPLVATTARADLEEKICVALGAIGSGAALTALAEIAESKSFLRVRVYPEKVKNAAGRALVSIRRKQAEATGTKK
ncbi:MAG TPA: HEAT repeat domain-containing protein, partial [Smithellaceae bacterium]|nr:HEAT repeat domain-containing protein [Smithellaceae bacterium]